MAKSYTNKTCKVNFITQMCNRLGKWQLNPLFLKVEILLSSSDIQQGFPKAGIEPQGSPLIHPGKYFSSSLTETAKKTPKTNPF